MPRERDVSVFTDEKIPDIRSVVILSPELHKFLRFYSKLRGTRGSIGVIRAVLAEWMLRTLQTDQEVRELYAQLNRELGAP